MADRLKKKDAKKKDKKDKNAPKLGLVFGRRLEEVIEMQNNGNFVPNIIRETIAWLEANGAISEEGLFRVPGQMTIIESLKKEYDTRGSASLEGITDVASVAGLLKLYLRELPEPLLVYRFYSTFVKIAKNPDAESRLRNLRILVNGLPDANKTTVFYLLQFLSKVVANEKVNRMSAANLAMIFSPNLLRTEKEELSQIMMEAGYLTSVVKMMIEEIDYMTNKTDLPATVKISSAPLDLLKPELDLSSKNSSCDENVPLEEMKRRLSVKQSEIELRAQLEAESVASAASGAGQPPMAVDSTTTTVADDNGGNSSTTTKLVGDESGSPISASEQKRKELEDIKQKVKEKEELLKLLQEQLQDDDDDDDDDEEDREGCENEDGEGLKGIGGGGKEENQTPDIKESSTSPSSAKGTEDEEALKEETVCPSPYGMIVGSSSGGISIKLDEFGGH